MVVNKLEIEVKGKVFGFQNEGESERDAISRILLEAEQHGNNGKSRLHLEPSGTIPASDDVITENYIRIGNEKNDRCPYCQAKIDFAGSYWPTTEGNFCSKEHHNKWDDARTEEERFGPQP
jgi:hypothetical protein